MALEPPLPTLLAPIGVSQWWLVTFISVGCVPAMTVCYHRRFDVPSGDDDMLPPLAWHTVRQWWCVHRRRPNVPSGGDDASIYVGLAYHPTMMRHPSGVHTNSEREEQWAGCAGASGGWPALLGLQSRWRVWIQYALMGVHLCTGGNQWLLHCRIIR
jgi:hypothetical protein